jgi:hypothetical protein
MLSVPDEGHSRNTSCELSWVSTFLFKYMYVVKVGVTAILFYYFINKTKVLLTHAYVTLADIGYTV